VVLSGPAGSSSSTSPKPGTASPQSRSIARATTSNGHTNGNGGDPSSRAIQTSSGDRRPNRRLPTLGASPSAPQLRSPLSSTFSPSSRSTFGSGGAARSPVRSPSSSTANAASTRALTSHGRLVHQSSATPSPKAGGAAATGTGTMASSSYRHDPLAALSSSPYASSQSLPVAEGTRRIFAGAVPLSSTAPKSGYVINSNGKKSSSNNTSPLNSNGNDTNNGATATAAAAIKRTPSKSNGNNSSVHGVHKSNGSNGSNNSSNEERRAAELIIEAFATKQNEALLRVIDDEQLREEERRRTYDATPADERQALDSLYAAERAEAGERIALMTK
jgi:hypothetical protein